jgi:sugar-specific transcriptional regulator TrmB
MSGNSDESIDTGLLKKLEELGLSEKESRVYLALLPRRDTGTSKLIRATGLHGQFVYDALERLEDLGLAKHVTQNGRKKFSANTPNRLVALIDEKKLAAHSIARELQNRFQGAHEQDFEVYQGREAFVAHEFQLMEEMPEGCTISILGGGGNSYVGMIGEEMEAFEKIRNRRGIKIRYISAAGQGENLKKMAAIRKNFEYRIFPHLENGLIDTDIWPDRLILQFYGDPVLSFTLTSKEIADSYQQFFEALWRASVK